MQTTKLAPLDVIPVGGRYTSSLFNETWTVLYHGHDGRTDVNSPRGNVYSLPSSTVLEITETTNEAGDVKRTAVTTWLPASAVRS